MYPIVINLLSYYGGVLVIITPLKKKKICYNIQIPLYLPTPLYLSNIPLYLPHSSIFITNFFDLLYYSPIPLYYSAAVICIYKLNFNKNININT